MKINAQLGHIYNIYIYIIVVCPIDNLGMTDAHCGNYDFSVFDFIVVFVIPRFLAVARQSLGSQPAPSPIAPRDQIHRKELLLWQYNRACKVFKNRVLINENRYFPMELGWPPMESKVHGMRLG